MIVTLTPNPSLDRTISVAQLRVGEVNRAGAMCVDAGGKGVNVSRALAANGSATVAVLPAGGAPAVQFAALLYDAHVAYHFIDLQDAVRTNITLVEDDGTTTKINEPGRNSGPPDAAMMLDAVESHLQGASWVVGCGSLPPGIDGSLYVALIERAQASGVRVAIDTSGATFAQVVEAGPDLVKPNLEELEEFAGKPLVILADVLEAARSLVRSGVGTVVVSLGEHGALGVDATTAVHANSVVDKPLSTVGAGDCLLAGYLSAVDTGASLTDAVARGVLWGSAAVALPGSRVPSPADLHGHVVHVSSCLPLDLIVSSTPGHSAPTP